jgi:hypothetical protein
MSRSIGCSSEQLKIGLHRLFARLHRLRTEANVSILAISKKDRPHVFSYRWILQSANADTIAKIYYLQKVDLNAK